MAVLKPEHFLPHRKLALKGESLYESFLYLARKTDTAEHDLDFVCTG
jgi:hypothetical protein